MFGIDNPSCLPTKCYVGHVQPLLKRESKVSDPGVEQSIFGKIYCCGIMEFLVSYSFFC